MRCVVSCWSKAGEATEAAHLGSLQCRSMVDRPLNKRNAAGSSPAIHIKRKVCLGCK